MSDVYISVLGPVNSIIHMLIHPLHSLLTLISGHASHIAIESNFELAERLSLNLARVLKFSYPISLLALQAGHLSLNLNSPFIFFIDSTN